MRSVDVLGNALTDTFKGMIARKERGVVFRVFVDWDRDGDISWTTPGIEEITKYVAKINVPRSLTTDLNAANRLVPGYASGTCTIDLGGDPADASKTAGLVWSPYSKTSPFYGKRRTGAPVLVVCGHPSALDANGQPTDFQYLSIFSGYVRSIKVSTADGTAQLEAYDGSERMHKKVNPPMVLSGDAFGNLTQRYGLNSQWFIDWLFRQCGYYASPPTRNTTVASMTMHGSMYPEVGVPIQAYMIPFGSDVQSTDKPPFTNGKYGMAAWATCPDGSNVTPTVEVQPVGSPVVDRSNGGIQVELLDYTYGGAWDGDGTQTFLNVYWQIGAITCHLYVMTDGHLRVDIGATTFVGPVISQYGFTYIGAHIKVNSTTNVTVTFNVAGVTTPVTQAITATWADGLTWGLAGISVNTPCESLQFSYEPTPNFTWQSFYPTAIIEQGMNEMLVLPYQSDAVDAWDTAVSVAQAEFGTIMFDENGALWFWNYQHRNAAYSYSSPAQNLMYATTIIEDIDVDDIIDNVCNRVTGTATPFSLQPFSWIYQLAEAFRLPARVKTTLWVSFTGPATNVPTSMTYGPYGASTHFPDPPTNWYRASTGAGNRGKIVTNLQFTVTPFATGAKIDIYNPNAFAVYLVSPYYAADGSVLNYSSVAGTPMLFIAGQLVTNAGNAAVISSDGSGTSGSSSATGTNISDDTSIANYGEQIYDMPQSDWLQRDRIVRDLCMVALADMARPIPQVPSFTIAADLRFQLFDLVLASIADYNGINTTAKIVGMNTTIEAAVGGSAGGLSNELQVRLQSGPEGWILGDSTFGPHTSQSILGVTTILGGKG